MPAGRPTKYAPELIERILEAVSTHQCGLVKLCHMYDWMPNADTIIAWRAKYDEFSERYLLARKKQAHLLADRCNELAEEINDFIYEDPKTGAQCIDGGIVAMQKLKISSKTWLASRIEPKIYGDKQVIENVTTENDALKVELAELRAKLAEKAKSEY
jgi:hypothetical protein